MKRIRATEPEEEKPVGKLKEFKERFKYNIKKMEVLAGKYNTTRPVILQQNALMKAVIYCAVTRKTQGVKEIMGWLAGKQEDGTVEVIDSYVGDCNSSSHYTELDPLETIKMKKLAAKRGLILVGQWHFHPGFSTTPSGIDDDFMRNLEKFGVKTPVQLICNMDDFSLTIMEKGSRRKAEFIIPPKTDNELRINLGFINGEHTFEASPHGTMYGEPYDESFIVGPFKAFSGRVGRTVFGVMNYIPFVNLTDGGDN